MYQRVVCFKFKSNTTKKAIQSHIDHFAHLVNEIPQILTYTGGLTCEDEQGIAPTYDTMHYATFRNFADIATYFHHPAHQAFIEANKAIWEHVFVLNSQSE